MACINQFMLIWLTKQEVWVGQMLRRFIVVVFAFSGALFISSSCLAKCKNDHAIWSADNKTGRDIVYGSKGFDYGSDLIFEEWRKGKLAWRGKGTVTCSNGASICYAQIENAKQLEGASTTDVIVEEIDAGRDGHVEWIVLAAAAQQLSYAGGLKVQWFNGFHDEGDYGVLIPNVFRFLTCRSAASLGGMQ